MRRHFTGLCGALLLLIAMPAQAVVCTNVTGSPTDISYDLSNTINGSNNKLNKLIIRSENSGWIGVQVICPAGPRANYTYRSYVSHLPVAFIAHGYKFLQINEHLQAAMSLSDSYAGEFYPPAHYVRMGEHPNVSKQQPFELRDSHLILKLRVTRQFMNRVTLPRQTLFTVYVTTSLTDPLTTPVYTISYSGVIDVPQRCEVNAGQLVAFNFGDINAALFSEAGAGHRPQGVTPQTKTLTIQCTNVAAQATITLRLEAENVSGQTMVSDNPDLGFMVANSQGQPFTPNNLHSKVVFLLDRTARATVGIRAWPVSVTGNKPAAGPFHARGYLRVEYD
ncbi:type 1 fimbria D-mannose specific adhesin FimH [Kosakonia sp. BYX6]|uniref:Type 1 fimbria D-mannose specific adhesin FimH n=1 Tax=Kosakonia calanthes TaxID=3139408 RepID=A0ABZ3B240_9ENTR